MMAPTATEALRLPSVVDAAEQRRREPHKRRGKRKMDGEALVQVSVGTPSSPVHASEPCACAARTHQLLATPPGPPPPKHVQRCLALREAIDLQREEQRWRLLIAFHSTLSRACGERSSSLITLCGHDTAVYEHFSVANPGKTLRSLAELFPALLPPLLPCLV